MTWHVLDVGSIWMKEFASALARIVPTVNWLPVMKATGAFENWERREVISSPPLQVRHFPLQRGYSRFPLSVLANLGLRQSRRMRRAGDAGGISPLICTTPFYAGVAERWGGPVIYYQTDLTYAYHGLDSKQIRALDTRLCRVATLVCPNSRRIAHYMVAEAGCDPAKIIVVPNATRAENVFEKAPAGPAPAPSDLADLPRPLVGVLGNLAANLDWCLLVEAVEQTPEFSWAFIGPYDMEVHDAPHREARERLLNRAGRIRFVGPKPYGALQEYARAIDVAVLPYRRKEPTYSGSSTRFYEHLAACRPMLATRGFEELLRKEPLLQLVSDGTETAKQLKALHRVHFEDGWREARWQASKQGTWQARAATVVKGLEAKANVKVQTSPVLSCVSELLEAGRYDGERTVKFALITPD